MKKNKTHFAEITKANESNSFDEEGTTLCGLEYTESPVTNKIEEVTCKKCLRAFPKYDTQMKHISENWSDYF
jgi:hypothetical protein